jgi:hypothetical protein
MFFSFFLIILTSYFFNKYWNNGERAYFEYFFIFFVFILWVSNKIIYSKVIDSKTILIIYAATMLLILPIGSDGGILNLGYYSIWMSFPIACSLIYDLVKNGISIKIIFNKINIDIKIINTVLISVIIIIIISFTIISVKNNIYGYYFNQGIITSKNYKINSKYAKNIYTDKKRADIINDILASLNKYVSPNDYLLCYDSIPILHYLTETKPYLYNSWLGGYPVGSFVRQLSRAEKQINVLPVLVIQKFNSLNEYLEPESEYFSEKREKTFLFNPNIVPILKEFIRKYNYEIVWSNEHFDIFKTDFIK